MNANRCRWRNPLTGTLCGSTQNDDPSHTCFRPERRNIELVTLNRVKTHCNLPLCHAFQPGVIE